jgi:hypothetical protein
MDLRRFAASAATAFARKQKADCGRETVMSTIFELPDNAPEM